MQHRRYRAGLLTAAERRQRAAHAMGQHGVVKPPVAAPPPAPPPPAEPEPVQPEIITVQAEEPTPPPVAPEMAPPPELIRRQIKKEIIPPMSFIPSLPTVVIVAADKGGVGKTMLSRVLCDYFKAQGLDVQPYDTESPKGALVRFHHDAQVVNLREFDDQSKVFDSLTRDKITLIDMRAGLLNETLALLSDVGFFDLARQGKINLAFMHIIGSTVASFNEIEDTANMLTGIKHFIVLNKTSTAEFFKGIDTVGKDALQRGTAVIEIPMLDPKATEHVEAAAVPFGEFEKDPKYSFMARGKVRKWENDVFVQLDALKLNPVI
jgi:hypothetical protein